MKRDVKRKVLLCSSILLLLFFLFLPLGSVPALAAPTSYIKPSLYQTGLPYIKYFKDKTGSITGFEGLTRSFLLDLGNLPAETAIISYGASAYDQTISGTIALDNNETTILDTYVSYYKKLTATQNPLISTSAVLSVKYGIYKMVRALGRDVTDWWGTWDWTVDTGATACLMRYALSGYQKTGNADYKAMAVLFGDYLLNLQDTDGGIRMGAVGLYHSSGTDFFWKTKSTEQNEQSLYALEGLYQITQISKYNTAATALKGWLKSMYNKTEHLYHSAATYNGTAWVKRGFDYVATDVMAFAPLTMMLSDTFFGATQQERDIEVDAMFQAIEQKMAFFDVHQQPRLFRFTLGQDGDYGSVEWSAQMALAYLRAAQNYYQRSAWERSKFYLDKHGALVANLQAYFFSPSDDANSKVAPYASYVDGTVAGGVDTGTGYQTLNCQAALASAYFVFAKAGYDPTKLDGGPGIPVIPLPPTTPVVSDEGKYTAKADQIYASWKSSSPGSGIAKYQYRITKGSVTGPVVRDWTSTGTYNDITAYIPLAHGKTYFFAVKAKNTIGIWSDVGYSDGIFMDATPPRMPVVSSWVVYKPYSKVLKAFWSSSDPESGIATYEYKITRGTPWGPVIRGWTSTGTATSVVVADLDLHPSQQYYFSVRARNHAKSWSVNGYAKVVTVAVR